MTLAQRYDAVLTYFAKAMPDAETELVFHNEYELLVAVILSAQCTDKRVNMVTPSLFRRWPDVSSLAKASETEVFAAIATVTYPNSKCRYLVQMAQMVMDVYGGKIPRTRDELMRLPGVGRKTANVMLSVIFHQAAMAVDTHVFRVSHRIGLVPPSCTTPLSVERMLTRHFAPEVLHDAHHWLILHGRYVCTAQKPKCQLCGLHDICQGKLV